MINAFRSEFMLLNRFRMWVIAGLTTVAFTVAATALIITTSEPISEGIGDGIPTEFLLGPGGATIGVIWSLAFGSILILASFISKVGNEFSRGTFRTALLHHPNRWTLIGGKIAALMAVTVTLMVLAIVTGAATSAAVAPSQDIDTAGWFGMDAFGEAATDFARLAGWAAGWAIIGTLIAVLVRSTPIAIGVGVLWFGPIENVIGEDLDLAKRWFPGQLLRAVVAPGAPDMESTGTAVATLGVYAAICAAIIGVVLHRRDVTA